MKINRKKIHEIIVIVLLDCSIHVDNITTQQWIDIIKKEVSKIHEIQPSDVELSYRSVLSVLNKLTSDGYYNVATESYYVKGDEAFSDDGPNHSKYWFFYT